MNELTTSCRCCTTRPSGLNLLYNILPAMDMLYNTTNGRAHNNSTTCCTTNSPITDKNWPHPNILTCRALALRCGKFVVQQVVELLWARPLVVLYNMSVAGVRVVEFGTKSTQFTAHQVYSTPVYYKRTTTLNMSICEFIWATCSRCRWTCVSCSHRACSTSIFSCCTLAWNTNHSAVKSTFHLGEFFAGDCHGRS